MQQSHDVRPKEDIETANRSFTEKHTDDELPEIDTKDSAQIADQIRRHQREKTPGKDDDRGVALKNFLQLLHALSVFSFESIIEMQGFRKIVDTHGGNHNTCERQCKQRQWRENRDGEKNQACRWNEREAADATDHQVRDIAGNDGGRHDAA